MPLSTWTEDHRGGYAAKNEKTGVQLYIYPRQNGGYALYLNFVEVKGHDGTLEGCKRLGGFYGADPLPNLIDPDS